MHVTIVKLFHILLWTFGNHWSSHCCGPSAAFESRTVATLPTTIIRNVLPSTVAFVLLQIIPVLTYTCLITVMTSSHYFDNNIDDFYLLVTTVRLFYIPHWTFGNHWNLHLSRTKAAFESSPNYFDNDYDTKCLVFHCCFCFIANNTDYNLYLLNIGYDFYLLVTNCLLIPYPPLDLREPLEFAPVEDQCGI